MTATEADIARRAGALCIYSEPHEDKAEWPCKRHLAEAARQLSIPSAPASTSFQRGTRPRVEGVNGGSGRVPAPPSGQGGTSTFHESNQPRAENPRLAEGATAIAQEGA